MESRKARLNEAGTFLMEFTDPQTSRILEEELRQLHLRWLEFTRANTCVSQRCCREAESNEGRGRIWGNKESFIFIKIPSFLQNVAISLIFVKYIRVVLLL